MRRRLMILALGALVMPTILLAADARVGSWKYNPAKSKFDPGPAYKSRTVTVEAAGEGIKVAVAGVSADDKPTAYSYTLNYDGKDYPITGNAAADTIAFKRIDDLTTEGSTKKGGQVNQTLLIAISKDRKTMTVTTKGKSESGSFTNVVVYDKQ